MEIENIAVNMVKTCDFRAFYLLRLSVHFHIGQIDKLYAGFYINKFLVLPQPRNVQNNPPPTICTTYLPRRFAVTIISTFKHVKWRWSPLSPADWTVFIIRQYAMFNYGERLQRFFVVQKIRPVVRKSMWDVKYRNILGCRNKMKWDYPDVTMVTGMF